MIKFNTVLLGFLLLLLISCSNSDTETQVSNQEQVAEIIEIKEVVPLKADQIESLISSFAGDKAVLINIWATWCIPCVEEFPHIAKVQKEFPDDLQVIFISADFPEEINRIHDFLKSNQVDWQTYIKDDRDEPFINAIWPEWSGAIPASIIYNKDGSHLTFFERSASYDEFKNLAVTAINS